MAKRNTALPEGTHDIPDGKGCSRYYYERADHFEGKRVRIYAEPGTREFFDIYNALHFDHRLPEDQRRSGKADPSKSSRPKAGSFAATVEAYFETADLKPANEGNKRRALRDFCESLDPAYDEKVPRGQWLLGNFTREHLESWVAQAAKASPSHARVMIAHVKPLFGWAFEKGKIKHNPAHALKPPPVRDAEGRVKDDGWWTWEAEQCAKFEAYHPQGTWPRLAYDFARLTWMRRSDIIRMGPSNIRNGELRWHEFKGSRHEIKPQVQPLDPELARGIELYLAKRQQAPVRELGCEKVFLTYAGNGKHRNGKAQRGRIERPYDDNAFKGRFGAAVKAAGLPACCTIHGVRKAAATEAAELGEDPHAIQAMLGHTTLEQTMVYIKKARRHLNAAELVKRRIARRATGPRAANAA
jgi:integrase